MKVAVVQTDPVFGEADANVRDALALMASAQADLYVLPELFNSGYNFVDKTEVESLAEPAHGKTYSRLSDFASKQACYIVYGFAESDGLIYNSAAFVGPDGLIGLYRKVHLFSKENILFAPGDLGFPVFNSPFGKLGMMVCFDWIYPESARSLMLNGAQIIAHPSNLVLPYCPDAMVTRCLENRVFAATANRIGREDRGGSSLSYIGSSEVVSPAGKILVRMESEKSGIRVVEIDPAAALSKRVNEFNDLASGRRTSQYSL